MDTDRTDVLPGEMPVGVAVALHLTPGLLLTGFFVLSQPLWRALGLPPQWGLLLGVPLVIAPWELGWLWRESRRTAGVTHLRAAVVWRPSRRRTRAWLIPVTTAASLLLSGAVIWAEPAVHAALLGWLPEWWSAGVPDLDSYPPGIRIATLVMWGLTVVVAGPVIEELYFRGHLLHRLPVGRARPLLHAALFSLYHFWQPASYVTVLMFALPLAYVAAWKKDLLVTIVAHCTANALAFAALLAGLMAR